MASHIADHLTVKIDNLSGPDHPSGGDTKRGRGRPRKDDKDPKPNASSSGKIYFISFTFLISCVIDSLVTGQKSYPCDWPLCGMWFSQSSNLNKHYLTHTNEKPFKCLWPNCNKSFKQSSNLNKHRFVHTGNLYFYFTILIFLTKVI